MKTELKSPLEMFYKWEQETPEKVFLRQPENLVWHEYTWADVSNSVRRIATFLLSKNLEEGSKIGIWSSNSKDWPIVDLAIMLSGHVSVPIYPGQDADSASYILDHSDAKLVFIGAVDRPSEAAKAIRKEVAKVAMLGCEEGGEADCETSLVNIHSDYDVFKESPIPQPDEIFTLVYTSGTTGNPKGVMHSYATPSHVLPSLANGLKDIGVKNNTNSEDRMFSYLPMSHIAERVMVEYYALYTNSSISFSQGLATFADELRSVQPTIFFAVPRIWLKFKQGVEANLPPEVIESLTDEQKQQIVHQLGLSNARLVITGSAPCPPNIQKWFLDKGIILREAYGATENFIHGCSWIKDGSPRSGCAGQPIDNTVEVRLSSNDEIQFKSKGLMRGYYLEPEKTAEVFDDGWYCSGDSGRFDSDGNLWITGRISDVFKTSKGKFVVPTALEDKFARTHLLAQLCILGHGLDSPLLIASLSEVGQALDAEQLRSELDALLDAVNQELASHEKVSSIFITPEWTIESGLLTPTLKIKRKKIEEHYRDEAIALEAAACVN